MKKYLIIEALMILVIIVTNFVVSLKQYNDEVYDALLNIIHHNDEGYNKYNLKNNGAKI